MKHDEAGLAEERRDRALDELIALEAQVEVGEITPDQAVTLRARYEAEAAAALRHLDAAATAPPATGRSGRRVAAGVIAFLGLAALVTVGLVVAVRPGSNPTTPSTIDLASVSTEEMEAVVAANPEVLGMRLALARRYVEAGEFSAALPHYLYILERENNPEALMYLGWMTYLSGDAATGVSLLEESLELAPDDALATWFLANALYHGLGDEEAALPLLEAVIASGAAPEDVVAEARRMIEEAAE